MFLCSVIPRFYDSMTDSMFLGFCSLAPWPAGLEQLFSKLSNFSISKEDSHLQTYFWEQFLAHTDSQPCPGLVWASAHWGEANTGCWRSVWSAEGSSLEVFCKCHQLLGEVHLQWDRAVSRWAEIQVCSPGKTDLLICEGWGQLIPAELAARLGTGFVGAGRIHWTMDHSVIIISAAGGVWFRVKFQVNWISLWKSLIREA